MLDHSEAYTRAMMAETAPTRRTLFRAVVDISDPDIVYGTPTGSDFAAWAKPEQLYDKVFDGDTDYNTLERGRWILGSGQRAIPDDPTQLPGQIGAVSEALSDDDGVFSPAAWVEQPFQNVGVLQSCGVYFSDKDYDGVPTDFTVEMLQGGTVYFSKQFTGNTDRHVLMDGFTVHDPDTIRVTCTKMSLPGRRLRVTEIVPGTYEEWGLSMVADLNIVQQGDVSCMSLPYGTCSLKINNQDRRFEPRNKRSLFQSIEERQGIRMDIGVRLADGTAEYKPAGVYFQKGDGWKTSGNEPTITWDLVDIIGLVTDRTFLPPETLPTTLEGWIAAIVGQLGDKFADCYHVDPDYADMPVTANSVDDVTGKKCGDILRWVCQASGTWPRASAKKGYLTAEPLWSEGGKLTLMNLNSYPTMKANGDIAALIFTLYDGNDTQVVISGTSASAADTKSISNPFIHTREQARAAAKLILATYGGNQLETTGRGDPASEIGDVDTVWLDESSATTGRRIYQTFAFASGVLQNCQSRFLQADGSFLYQEFELITKSGKWTGPAGATKLRVALGGGGQGGGKGQDGYVSGSGLLAGEGVTAGTGEDGVAGSGGLIWYGTIDINDGQQFDVNIGAGGAPSDTYGVAGALGTATTFGAYSSANGKVFANGYTDIANGGSYGRSGVDSPLDGTSDGGAGGEGGAAGAGYWEQLFWPDGRPRGWNFRITQEPGTGKAGKPGASGFALVFWDK